LGKGLVTKACDYNEIIKQALAKSLRDLLDKYGLRKKSLHMSKMKVLISMP
jgi:hypothetical protein